MQDGVEPGPLTKLRQARGSFGLGLRVQAHYLCLMKYLSNRGWAFGAALSLAIVPAVAPAQSIDLNRPLTTLSPAQLQNLNNRKDDSTFSSASNSTARSTAWPSSDSLARRCR